MTALQGWRRVSALSLSEAADVASISRARMYEIASEGGIPTTRDPQRRLRVLPADLEAWLAERAPNGIDQPDLFTEPVPSPLASPSHIEQAGVVLDYTKATKPVLVGNTQVSPGVWPLDSVEQAQTNHRGAALARASLRAARQSR